MECERDRASRDWHFAPGLAEGRPALLVSDPAAIRCVVLLDWAAGRSAAIRDVRFAPYVVDGMDASPL